MAGSHRAGRDRGAGARGGQRRRRGLGDHDLEGGPLNRHWAFLQCTARTSRSDAYLCEVADEAGERRVIVRVLRDDVSEDASTRMRDEAALSAQLEHPHIHRVSECIEIDGRLALVSEALSGGDLDTAASLPGFGPRIALTICAAVARALHHAWVAVGPDGTPLQAVHRGIKPSNILVTAEGQVRLADFGMATFTGRDMRTAADQLVGALATLSPERMTDGPADPRSDVYALGTVLYGLLEGRSLWEGLQPPQHFACLMHAEVHAAHLQDRLQAMPLAALLTSMMSFDPLERPEADVVAERLASLAASADGASLAPWCADTTWPPLPSIEGALVGAALRTGLPSFERPETAFERLPDRVHPIHHAETVLLAPEVVEALQEQATPPPSLGPPPVVPTATVPEPPPFTQPWVVMSSGLIGMVVLSTTLFAVLMLIYAVSRLS